MSYYQAQHILNKCFRNKTNRLSAGNMYSVQDYFNAVYDEEHDALRICVEGSIPESGGGTNVSVFKEGYADIENGVVINFYSDENMENLITPNSDQFFIDINTDALYRWNGVEYIEISSIELGDEEGTAYPGNKGKELEQQIKNLEKTINNQYIIVSSEKSVNLLNQQTAICVVENCNLNLPAGTLGGFVKVYVAKGASVKITSKQNYIGEENYKELILNKELTYLIMLYDNNSNTWYLTYSDSESHLVI